MHQLLLGKISDFSADALPPEITRLAPEGVRRQRWLAGRVLLSRFFPQLPEITYGPHGKPAFHEETPVWFNFSHSGDDIALFLSDEGEVGCDIEVIRPRKNWQAIAREVFSVGELDEINAQNFAGNTALHYCMANSDLTAAKMLVDAGANRDVKNLNGVSPLLWAFVTENGSRMNLKWQPTTVQAVGELAQGSKFSFNDKLPLFEKSLNQIFLENGDAASSKAASAFN